MARIGNFTPVDECTHVTATTRVLSEEVVKRVTIAVRRATHDNALIVHSLNNLLGTDSVDIETHQAG